LTKKPNNKQNDKVYPHGASNSQQPISTIKRS
jgi:hypothetical protein